MNVNIFTHPKSALIVASVSIPLLGYIDFVTGWEFGFFAFYFIPIAYSSWYGGTKPAIFISIISAMTWFLADYLLHPAYSSAFFAFWNTLIRMISFLLVALFVSRISRLLSSEKKVSGELREAIAQIKTLRGFLPICASCKKIRNDKGYWEQLESYIASHSEAEFTHGICDACARRLYPSVFSDEDSKKGDNA